METLKLLRFPETRGENTMPVAAFGYIGLGKFSHFGKNKEHTVISHRCHSLGEIEQEADRLIGELKKIKEQARRFFDKK